jgi:hypothetical protein
MRNLITGGLVAILLLAGLAPAYAADPVSKAVAEATPDLPAVSTNWSGPYVGVGASWDAYKLEAEGTPFAIGVDDASALARLGYRYQLPGSRIVGGVFVEGSLTDLSLVDEVKSNYALAAGGDLGLALGGVLVSVVGGWKWQPTDVGPLDFTLDGPFAGVRVAADLGAGFDLSVEARRDFISDEQGDLKLDANTTSGMVVLSKRF